MDVLISYDDTQIHSTHLMSYASQVAHLITLTILSVAIR